jgi:hypothetical protein
VAYLALRSTPEFFCRAGLQENPTRKPTLTACFPLADA